MTSRPPTSPHSPPEFLKEAAADDLDAARLERDAGTLLEALAPIATEPVDRRQLERLTQAVSHGALRFAPFFDQLEDLFQRDEAEIERLLADGPWHMTGLPGVRIRDVELGPALAGCEGRLTLFRPGTRFPSHTHGGRERVLVLQGSFTDAVTGEVFAPGDLQEMSENTSHAFVVDRSGPCISASVHDRPFRFDSALLRLWGKLFGH